MSLAPRESACDIKGRGAITSDEYTKNWVMYMRFELGCTAVFWVTGVRSQWDSMGELDSAVLKTSIFELQIVGPGG